MMTLIQMDRAIKDLYNKVNNIITRVLFLENKNPCTPCTCEPQPYYREHNIDFLIWNEEIGEYVLPEIYVIDDIFPNEACPDTKGILFTNDVIIFCRLHSEDGWIITGVTNKL